LRVKPRLEKAGYFNPRHRLGLKYGNAIKRLEKATHPLDYDQESKLKKLSCTFSALVYLTFQLDALHPVEISWAFSPQLVKM